MILSVHRLSIYIPVSLCYLKRQVYHGFNYKKKTSQLSALDCIKRNACTLPHMIYHQALVGDASFCSSCHSCCPFHKFMTMIRYELVIVFDKKIALKSGGHLVCLFYIFCMLVMLYERIELCLQKLLIKRSPCIHIIFYYLEMRTTRSFKCLHKKE